MRPGAIAVLLLAAVLHATWNLLLKREPDRLPLIGGALFCTALVGVPFLVFGPGLPAAGWPYAIGCALLNFLYFLTLAEAYARADFSVVYPIARGGAPVLMAFGAVGLLHEHLSTRGILGITLVLGGLVLVGIAAPQPPEMPTVPRPGRRFGLTFAVLSAALIAAYSLIDASAVRRFPSLAYALAVFSLDALLFAVLLLLRRDRRALVGVLRAGWLKIVVVSVLWSSAYAAVLAVYAVSPAAYTGAVREVSVILGSLAGWLWLGEGFGPRRTAGASLAFVGILLIAGAR
jgi:drug/metabolite transporter (DMT)-like permease